MLQMIIQRSCFTAAKILLWFAGMIGGGSGGYLVSKAMLGGTQDTALHFIVTLAAVLVAALVSAIGVQFGIVLPLHFAFPNARKAFEWESRDPHAVFRLYRWYGQNLSSYGELRLRGEL